MHLQSGCLAPGMPALNATCFKSQHKMLKHNPGGYFLFPGMNLSEAPATETSTDRKAKTDSLINGQTPLAPTSSHNHLLWCLERKTHSCHTDAWTFCRSLSLPRTK